MRKYLFLILLGIISLSYAVEQTGHNVTPPPIPPGHSPNAVVEKTATTVNSDGQILIFGAIGLLILLILIILIFYFTRKKPAEQTTTENKIETEKPKEQALLEVETPKQESQTVPPKEEEKKPDLPKNTTNDEFEVG
ncbi:MAG: hypothetical protein AABX38_07520 [Candidatus Micrarchaeota archaeon]